MASIPLIDISRSFDSTDDTSGDHANVVAEIDRACRDVGFFAITGHSIGAELQAEMLAAGRAFFDQPDIAKRAVAIENSSHHRGYAAIGGEQLQPDLLGDAKETLDFGMERSTDEPDCSPLEGPNQWPAIAGLRETVQRYQQAALTTAGRLLRLMAEALELRPDFFEPALTHPLMGTRLVHYPPVDHQEIDRQLGCGAHSDYGCVTLLLTDGVAGLQLLNADGDWMSVSAPRGALIVNLGDLLARWTNDVYRSTKHRVISPTDRHRYSVPVFVDPAYMTVVECLPSCVSPERPRRYERVLAGEYLRSRFDDTFAYRHEA